MKTILFTALLRNNENYVPYMLKLFDKLEDEMPKEYVIKRLIYTNNNADNTVAYLEKNKSSNMEIISENLKNVDTDEDVNELGPKVKRLYRLRQNLLEETLKREFDYLFMFDSDIYFNPSIISRMVSLLDTTTFEAITPNTVGQMLPLYYDSFALRTKNNGHGRNIFTMLNFHRTCFKRDIIEVQSAFCGIFSVKSSTLRSKNPSYISDDNDYKECEHVPFVKHFKTGVVPDLTPIRVKVDSKHKHDQAYAVIQENNTDNRNFYNIFAITLLILFALVCLYMVRFNYLYGVPFIISLPFIYNYFDEFM